jgi:hypothetical protein
VTTLVYLYAVAPRPIAAAIVGIDHMPVRWIAGDGLAAAVSDVSADEFDEEPLNANVKDMAWLGPRAVAHQEVNARVFEASEAIVPLAFGTVFRDDDRVRAVLHDRSEALRAGLGRVSGCAEWVVALHLLREPDAEELAAASPAVQSLRAQIKSSSPGRAHLLRRQLVTLEHDEARRVQLEVVAGLMQSIRAVAVEVYQEPLPSDTVEKPLLRASVLVQRAAEPAFMDEVDRLRNRWPEPAYRLLLTGPWPPYRFGGLSTDHS